MIFHSLMTRLYGVTSYNLPLYSVMENTNLNILKNVGVGYLNFTSLPNITKFQILHAVKIRDMGMI